jgi:hypothetical protein
MQKIINYLLFRKINFIVWQNQATYRLKWQDLNLTQEGIFNYEIKYYPYRLAKKYELSVFPNYIRFYPADKFYGTSHAFYSAAVKKLQEFERGTLIEQLICQD